MEMVAQGTAGIDCAQAVVLATVALVCGAASAGTQARATRRLQVSISP
jgi:hypothetical protein